MTKKFTALAFVFLFTLTACYHAKPVKVLPNTNSLTQRTLLIGLDGVDFTLINELKKEGHFTTFLPPVPLISTFPTATTIGFTGLYQPLGVGQVPGYEARFYSRKENKVKGGTPFDIYKIPIKYKYYFDTFRHTMQSKGVMYGFPSMASKQDLVNTKKFLFSSDKRLVTAYLGGTDGSAHLLGRNRTKRTLIFMDEFLMKLQARHIKEKGEPLRIILFSDHGFYYNKLKTVNNSTIQKELERVGLTESGKIKNQNDVVLPKFGVISAGVGFTHKNNRATASRALVRVPGIELAFWPEGKKRIHVINQAQEEAVFEFKNKNLYRYQSIKGDPLKYLPALKRKGFHTGQYLSAKTWQSITYDHLYPEAGYRLYDAFFVLVKNNADFMFSLEEDYQYGSLMARVGTWGRFGQRGTHGTLHKQNTWAFTMSNDNPNTIQPQALRYDELFPYYLPKITSAYKKKLQKNFAQQVTHDHHKEQHQDDLKGDLDQLAALLLE